MWNGNRKACPLQLWELKEVSLSIYCSPSLHVVCRGVWERPITQHSQRASGHCSVEILSVNTVSRSLQKAWLPLPHVLFFVCVLLWQALRLFPVLLSPLCIMQKETFPSFFCLLFPLLWCDYETTKHVLPCFLSPSLEIYQVFSHWQ